MKSRNKIFYGPRGFIHLHRRVECSDIVDIPEPWRTKAALLKAAMGYDTGGSECLLDGVGYYAARCHNNEYVVEWFLFEPEEWYGQGV
jgi:hypothetical protein